MEQNTLVGLFDTHAHPTDERFDEDRAEVLARMRAGNMLCMCVGSDMASSEQSLKLARENEQIYAAVGVHPHDAKSFREEDIPTLTRWLTEEPRLRHWAKSVWIITMTCRRVMSKRMSLSVSWSWRIR